MIKTMQTEAQIRELNKRKQYMEDNQRTTLHELLKKQPQEIVDRFEALTLMVVGLVDLVDGLIMDENVILDKITDGKMQMHITDICRQIKELTHKFVVMTDHLSNDATAENYGEFSDSIKPWLTKKAEEHLAWAKLQNENIKYATD